MARTFAEIEVSNIEVTKLVRMEAIIDSNAGTSALLPTKLAEETGILNDCKDTKVSVGDKILVAKRCSAFLRLKGKEFLGPVFIAEWVDKPTVGRFALEAMGLKVNPETGELEDTQLYMYSET